MAKYEKADIERRMKGAVESLKGDLSGLRTGRANTSLLDPVVCEVYGAMMPLNQVATVSVPEPRLISVQVWDKGNVGPVEKAIRSAGLGLNPITDGTMLKRAPNDVGGLLDTTKGWTLNIPLPSDTGSAARAGAERQSVPATPARAAQIGAPATTTVIAAR